MNANQSDDACSDPHHQRLPPNAVLNREAARLPVYEWERLAYTDAANTAAPGSRAPFELFTRLKVLMRSFLSRRRDNKSPPARTVL